MRMSLRRRQSAEISRASRRRRGSENTHRCRKNAARNHPAQIVDEPGGLTFAMMIVSLWRQPISGHDERRALPASEHPCLVWE